MTCLGAIIAGGKSSRFGNDKALAQWCGQALIDHVAHALAAQCDHLVVVGRSHDGLASCKDYPEPERGPLGGIAGALGYAQANGFAFVMTAGVDTVPFPSMLRDCLTPAPAHVLDNPLIGLWPTSLLAMARALASSDEDRSLRHFARQSGARQIALAQPPFNINTEADLAALEALS